MDALTPDAVAQLDVPRGNVIAVDPRSRELETVGERAHQPLTYRPDLDGLRALAVLGVVANHMFLPNGLPSGVVGVTAFFVLSGYLITTLLLQEREGAGRVAIRAFYGRRIRRLAPGLAILLIFVTIVGLAGGWHVPWVDGVIWSLAYAANFARGSGLDMGPLKQTWTLGIEEQFYLVWPFVALLFGRRGVIAAALLSIGLNLVQQGGLDPTSSIAFGALLGAIGLRVRPRSALFGLAVLAGLCTINWLPSPLQYTAIALATGLVVTGRTPLGFLAPLGRRAYEIYLWDFTLTTLFGLGIGGLLAFPAAELTYRATARFRRRRSYAPPETLTMRMKPGFQFPAAPAPAMMLAVPDPVIALTE